MSAVFLLLNDSFPQRKSDKTGLFKIVFFSSKGTSNGTQPYAELPPEALFANSLGVLIVAFGLVVLKILSNQKWQRPDAVPEQLAYSVSISWY